MNKESYNIMDVPKISEESEFYALLYNGASWPGERKRNSYEDASEAIS